MNLFFHENEADIGSTETCLSEPKDVHTTPDEGLCQAERQPVCADVSTLVRIAEAEISDLSAQPTLTALISILAFVCATLGTFINSNSQWILTSVAGILAVPVVFRRSNRIRDQKIATQYSHLDRRWIGPLCEALYTADSRVRSVAALLLEQLLPHLTDADLGLLTEEQLTCLFRCLTIPSAIRNPDLVIAILNALPAIGGEFALLLVERLAAYPTLLPNSRRIRAAARAAQTLLDQRVMPVRSSIEVNSAQNEADTREMTESERRAHEEMAVYVDGQIKRFEAAREKLQNPGMRFSYLIASYVIIVPYVTWQACLAFSAGQWAFSTLLGLTAALGTQLHRLTMLPQHHAIAESLAELDDVRAIGRLAEMLEWPDEDVRDMAIVALTRLLPRVKATDRVFSSPRQRENLRRLMNPSNAHSRSALIISLLKALEQVGAAEDLPYVQQLASTQPVWGVTIPYSRKDAARLLAVRAAARDCMPYLEKRAVLGQHSQTLLRASCATTAGSEMLVRAADGNGGSNPAELLRAQVINGDQVESVSDGAKLYSR